MNITLLNSDPSPLYEQIEKQVIEQMINGKLAPGDLLPSIRVLAKELGISVITVKKAYDDLERSGYIITKAGKGSFIAQAGAEFVKESKLKDIQVCFEKGIELCRTIDMSYDDIIKTFKVILDEK